MRSKLLLPVIAAAAVAAATVSTPAQQRGPVPTGGRAALGIALRQLGNVGVFLQTTAHPDDENSACSRSSTAARACRTALLTVTRGTGGQNEIGPELFEALARAAHVGAAGGAPLRRRRAVLRPGHRLRLLVQHGRDASEVGPGGDPRRTTCASFRTLRPDVVLTMRARRARAAASTTRRRRGSPARRSGGRPTRRSSPSRSRRDCGRGSRESCTDTGSYGFRGRAARRQSGVEAAGREQRRLRPAARPTYNEVGCEARSYHKCQGEGAGAAAARPADRRDTGWGTPSLPGGARPAETPRCSTAWTPRCRPGAVRAAPAAGGAEDRPGRDRRARRDAPARASTRRGMDATQAADRRRA